MFTKWELKGVNERDGRLLRETRSLPIFLNYISLCFTNLLKETSAAGVCLVFPFAGYLYNFKIIKLLIINRVVVDNLTILNYFNKFYYFFDRVYFSNYLISLQKVVDKCKIALS